MTSNQIKKTLIIYIAVIITVLFSSLALASAPRCADIFRAAEATRISEDPFVNSDRVEESLNSLITEISSKFGADQAQNGRLEQVFQRANEEAVALQRLQERLIEGEPISPVEFQDFHARIAEIREAMVEATRPVETTRANTSGSQRLELNDLIVDPTKVEAERPYTVELVSREQLSVIISEGIARDVFLDPSRKRVVSRSLRKIQKGIFGSGYSGDGIIRMITDANIVEVRASGKDGNFRFFGYLDNGTLHIVLHTMSSNHNGMTSTLRSVRQTMSIRDQRGH